mgnify:CR=1 FL=1
MKIEIRLLYSNGEDVLDTDMLGINEKIELAKQENK